MVRKLNLLPQVDAKPLPIYFDFSHYFCLNWSQGCCNGFHYWASSAHGKRSPRNDSKTWQNSCWTPGKVKTSAYRSAPHLTQWPHSRKRRQWKTSFVHDQRNVSEFCIFRKILNSTSKSVRSHGILFKFSLPLGLIKVIFSCRQDDVVSENTLN